jgi:hypothetical protein
MAEATAEELMVFYACMLVLFVPLAGYLWNGIYKLWKREFRGKHLSTAYQASKLIGWLLLVAATLFITTFVLFPLWVLFSLITYVLW